jgi:hypothetical protein
VRGLENIINRQDTRVTKKKEFLLEMVLGVLGALAVQIHGF